MTQWREWWSPAHRSRSPRFHRNHPPLASWLARWADIPKSSPEVFFSNYLMPCIFTAGACFQCPLTSWCPPGGGSVLISFPPSPLLLSYPWGKNSFFVSFFLYSISHSLCCFVSQPRPQHLTTEKLFRGRDSLELKSIPSVSRPLPGKAYKASASKQVGKSYVVLLLPVARSPKICDPSVVRISSPCHHRPP